jgi:phage shock protein PspC (stress-responsive transcriptional regulator)
MNKTININLGGLIFYIDENAYALLKNYLEAVANSLNEDVEGKTEIIADIEARISELLSEKKAHKQEAIQESDIEEVILVMGQPEDYSDAAQDANEDPSVEAATNAVKKLYRDADNRFLGGVASGIGHYVKVDAIWFRFAFLIAALGGGFGIPIYILLWLLVPKAKTSIEKLEMKGAPVNIDNIEKTIRKGFEKASQTLKNKEYGKVKLGVHRLLNILGTLVLRILKVFGKALGFFVIFISGLTLISLALGLFSLGSFQFLGINDYWIDFSTFFFESIIPKQLLTILVFVAFAFPFLMLLLLGLKAVNRSVKTMNKSTFLTLLGIWIVALLGLLFTRIEHKTATAFEGSKVHNSFFETVKNDTLQIKIVNNDNLYYKSNFTRKSGQNIVYAPEKKLYSSNVEVTVVQSNSSEATLKIRKTSEGKNRKIATENAERIAYNYTRNNNTLLLDGYLLSGLENTNKDDQVSVQIAVPEGVVVYFGNSTRSFLYDIDNVQNIDDNDLVNRHFLMTSKGLECTDCDEKVY